MHTNSPSHCRLNHSEKNGQDSAAKFLHKTKTVIIKIGRRVITVDFSFRVKQEQVYINRQIMITMSE